MELPTFAVATVVILLCSKYDSVLVFMAFDKAFEVGRIWGANK
jgi:hypothetical protein